MIDAVATVDESGSQYSIALINRHPTEDVTCTLKMNELRLDGTYPATILTAESTDTYNDTGHPERVAPGNLELTFKAGAVTLPAHSLVIVQIQRGK